MYFVLGGLVSCGNKMAWESAVCCVLGLGIPAQVVLVSLGGCLKKTYNKNLSVAGLLAFLFSFSLRICFLLFLLFAFSGSYLFQVSPVVPDKNVGLLQGFPPKSGKDVFWKTIASECGWPKKEKFIYFCLFFWSLPGLFGLFFVPSIAILKFLILPPSCLYWSKMPGVYMNTLLMLKMHLGPGSALPSCELSWEALLPWALKIK